MAYIPDLPFQQGRPRSLIEEEGVFNNGLVDYINSHDSPPDCQVYMMIGDAEDLRGDEAHYANELLDQISADELSTNAPPAEPQAEKEG